MKVEEHPRAIAPSKFAHVVYKTHKFVEMIDWYIKVFGAKVQHRDDRLAFLTYDSEHHRFAFINLGDTSDERPRSDSDAGVHHVAYTWKNLGGLLETYRRLKSHGIVPAQPIRHGLTLSLYYADPDKNMMEFQIDLMEPQAANDFMRRLRICGQSDRRTLRSRCTAGPFRRGPAGGRSNLPLRSG